MPAAGGISATLRPAARNSLLICILKKGGQAAAHQGMPCVPEGGQAEGKILFYAQKIRNKGGPQQERSAKMEQPDAACLVEAVKDLYGN
jgi:hypothetical protein